MARRYVRCQTHGHSFVSEELTPALDDAATQVDFCWRRPSCGEGLRRVWRFAVAPLPRFSHLAKRAPMTSSGEQDRPAGVVARCRGQVLALGRMLEAIKR